MGKHSDRCYPFRPKNIGKIIDLNAWVQTGTLDNMAHKQQMKMSLNIDAVLENVVVRIDGLLKAGWKNIALLPITVCCRKRAIVKPL